MASNYPGGLDSFPTRVDDVDHVLAADHNNLANAITAIEAELGLNPSAGLATVAARLTAIDAALTELGTIGGSVVSMDADGTLTINGTPYEIATDANVTAAISALTTTVNDALALKANDTAVVHLTGAESVAGVKTFAALPVIPTTAPSAAGHVVSKSALDAVVAGLPATFAQLLTVAAVASANGALVVGQHNPVDATAAARTMTLADAMAAGQHVVIEKTDATANAVTISGNIRGSAGTLVLTSQRESIELLAKADGSWWPIAGHRTKSSLDAVYAQVKALRRDAYTSARVPAPYPNVMPTPPTITHGTTFGSPTIASPQTMSAASLTARLRAARLVTVSSGGFTYYQGATTGASGGLAGLRTSFEVDTDAAVLELNLYGAASFNLEVDGQYASATTISNGKNNGDRSYTKIDFGSSKPRSLRFTGFFGGIASVLVGPTATLFPPRRPPGTTWACLTDSYGQFTSPYNAYDLYAMAGQMLGWDDHILSAVGGTGFLNTNTTYTTFRQRAQADIIDQLPANGPVAIGVFGGINDQGRQSKATLQAETSALFAMLRNASPSAAIVAGGPWCPNQANASTSNYTDVRDAILGGLQTITGPWVFIDPLTNSITNSLGPVRTLTNPWFTGSGYATATTGTGNADLYIRNDATHPTQAGQVYLASRIAEAIDTGLALYQGL